MLYIFNFFFFNDTATTEIYTLSLHDALPIWVMDELPELRMVGRYGVGYDIVDVEAARERGVWVANVPDYGTEEVAVHALSLDRKSTRLNSSHANISYAVFCLKKKKIQKVLTI